MPLGEEVRPEGLPCKLTCLKWRDRQRHVQTMTLVKDMSGLGTPHSLRERGRRPQEVSRWPTGSILVIGCHRCP